LRSENKLKGRIEELRETGKYGGPAEQPGMKDITPARTAFSNPGQVITPEMKEVICPDCISANYVKPGQTSYKCSICGKDIRIE
jgi:hypothetical protein